MKRVRGLLIAIAVILAVFGAVWISEKGISLIPGRGAIKGNITRFTYSYGSYNGGYHEYDLSRKGDTVTFTASGGNGVDLDIDTTVDPAKLDELRDIINTYAVYSWDGFHKRDDSILDGFSFRIFMTSDDERMIDGGGYMKYPGNFRTAHEALCNYFDKLIWELQVESGEIQIEGNPEELFEAFKNDWIPAIRITEDGQEETFLFSSIYNEDSPNNYYIDRGERVDLDNDGEKEMVLSGAYGMYLDARDGKLYVLAERNGVGYELCYVKYEGVTYIVQKNTWRGTRIYNMYEYNVNGEVVDSFSLAGIYAEEDNDPETVEDEFTFKGEKITKEEFETLQEEIFGVPKQG